MSLITAELWRAYLPGDMPEATTYEQFTAAREVMFNEKDKADSLTYLNQLRETITACENETVLEYLEQELEKTVKELSDGL